MADIKINDIEKQRAVASRVVITTDYFCVMAGDGTSVRIPAQFARAYLINGITPEIGSDGKWYVGGSATDVQAEGVSPQLRGGTNGIEVSYDKGKTWKVLVLYSEMDELIVELENAYKQIIASEESRKTAEQGRVDAEKLRASSETKREADFKVSKKSADDATSSANTAATSANNAAKKATDATAELDTKKKEVDAAVKECKTATGNANAATSKANTAATNADTQRAACKKQTDIAKDVNDHPNIMGDNGNWWKWNTTAQQYEDTGIIARGGVMFPSFRHRRNKLLMLDYGSNIGERVARKRNKLLVKL